MTGCVDRLLELRGDLQRVSEAAGIGIILFIATFQEVENARLGELRREAKVGGHSGRRGLGDVVVELGACRLCDLEPSDRVRSGLGAVADVLDGGFDGEKILVAVNDKVDMRIYANRISQ
jgi:hypothetical protein